MAGTIVTLWPTENSPRQPHYLHFARRVLLPFEAVVRTFVFFFKLLYVHGNRRDLTSKGREPRSTAYFTSHCFFFFSVE